MGIESATFISQLVGSNPTGADDYGTADDHLRLLKAVLQAQFPNLGAAACTALAADFNILTGADAGGLTAAELLFVKDVTSAIQAQLNGKASTSHNHAAADITSGTFADAQITQSSVTQHEAALDHDALVNFVGDEHIDWNDTGVEDIHADRFSNAPAASESAAGVVERATQTEVDTGTDTTRFLSIASLLASAALGVETGSFVATWIGFTTSPTTTWNYTRIGNMVIMAPSGTLSATSNATGFISGATDVPASLRPTVQLTSPYVVTNSGSQVMGRIAVSAAGALSFLASISNDAFANSGTKGFIGGPTFTYFLD